MSAEATGGGAGWGDPENPATDEQGGWGGPPGAPTAGQQQYQCENCGAHLKFAAGTTSLQCPYCGHRQEVAQEEGREVREHSFEAFLALGREGKPTGHVGRYTVRCSGCGAGLETDKLSDRCPFCGAAIVVEADAGELIEPEAVLPFGIVEKAAVGHVGDWVSSRWFAPNALRSLAAHDGIQGTYLPFWTFDSSTTTDYSGQRGEYYWDTESYTDSDGKTQTRQVRRTAWYSASGRVRRFFDDVLVPAVSSLTGKSLHDLEPWDLPEAKPYRPEYLAGFQTLRYEMEPETGFERFQQQVRPVIDEDCRRDIGGDEQRVHRMDTAWDDVTFKLLLLPVWLAAYRYHDRVFRVMVNARTGEVIGERPYSAWKITGLVLLVLVLALVGFFVYSATQGTGGVNPGAG